MKSPIIDNRNYEDIYNQILGLAKGYVPKWNTDNSDVGIILSRLFSSMFEETVQRYNKIPFKNYLYFLNMLGADTLSGVSSRGYVTVKMNTGEYEGVMIKKGTHLYSVNEDNERILYETKDDLYSVDNEVEAVFCTDCEKNIIIKSFDKDNDNNQPIKLFDFGTEENLQKLRITFSENDVFNITKEAGITVTVINKVKPYLEEKTAGFLCNGEYAKWEYLSEKGWKSIDKVECVGNQINIFPNSEIEENSYEDIIGRWLSCTILKRDKEAEYSFTSLLVSSKASKVSSENLYYNDEALTKNDFLPFGSIFSPYDDFYINCDKAFSKKGAYISINFEVSYQAVEAQEIKQEKKMKWKPIIPESVVKTPEPVSVNVERVVWEYWNGTGWDRLFENNVYEDVFARGGNFFKISFVCPENIQSTVIGAGQGKWIRARILSINNMFEINKFYNAPVINNISIDFSYKNHGETVKQIFMEKDLEVKKIFPSENKVTEIIDKNDIELPSIYFSLKNKLNGGPIKIYFQNAGGIKKNLPALKWEGLVSQNGALKWKEIKVMDETDFFSKSGILTFICNDELREKKIFGRESFWIRAVNTDLLYQDNKNIAALPILNGIFFNTVKVYQQETMQSEYFFIEEEEQNKICDLSEENIILCCVWVNEIKILLADDLNGKNLVEKENTIIERDEQGVITEYWVKWERTDSFYRTDSNSKVYMLDEKRGKILFGDGKRGKIPYSYDKPSIRVKYSIGAGEKGNCDINKIQDFADSVPFVDKVFNIEPINGGIGIESVNEAIARCGKIIKVQNKAVSFDDFESVITKADRNIAKVKIKQSADKNSLSFDGGIIVSILPKELNSSESYFVSIKNNVMEELRKTAPLTLVSNEKITVSQVKYIEFSVIVDVSIENFNDYQDVYFGIEKKLNRYFDPINGNYDGKGFEIGEMPSKIKIYNWIKTVEKIKSIDNIYIICYEIVNGYKKETDYSNVFNFDTGIPVNGTHDININIL